MELDVQSKIALYGYIRYKIKERNLLGLSSAHKQNSILKNMRSYNIEFEQFNHRCQFGWEVFDKGQILNTDHQQLNTTFKVIFEVVFK